MVQQAGNILYVVAIAKLLQFKVWKKYIITSNVNELAVFLLVVKITAAAAFSIKFNRAFSFTFGEYHHSIIQTSISYWYCVPKPSRWDVVPFSMTIIGTLVHWASFFFGGSSLGFLSSPLSTNGCSSFFASFCIFGSGDSKNAEITLQLQWQVDNVKINRKHHIIILCILFSLENRGNEHYLWPCAHNSLFPFKAFSHKMEPKSGQSKINFLMVRLEWKFSRTCSSCDLGIAARDAIALWREFILSSKVGCSMPPEPPVATYSMNHWI